MGFWDEDVQKESKAKRTLIKQALENATPQHLLAVRQYLKRYNCVYGYDSIDPQKTAAIKAFDKGEYDDPNISFLVVEGELAEILQNPEKAIKICGKVKKDSLS